MNHIETVITQKSAEITCNFDQVKEAIKERLAEYEGITFTEESKAYAKKDVASLRKEKKGLQDKLTAEKKRYMEPWERFEVQAKALISIYDEPINVISGQLQAFEESFPPLGAPLSPGQSGGKEVPLGEGRTGAP